MERGLPLKPFHVAARSRFKEKTLSSPSMVVSDAAGRRTRAPRLADLPRHTAVDVASGSSEQEKEVHQNGQQSCALKTNNNVYKENAAADRLQVSRSGLQHARSADGGSPRRPARESRRVSLAQAADYVQLNQYKLLEPIGQGSYGIVKLAYNEEDETHYAMKILSKRKLLRRAGVFGRAPPRRPASAGPAADPLHRIYREIAVLKKLDHPNVVKLVEVLDDPAEDQLYLVFQLLEGGPVIEVPTAQPLEEDVARSYFRDALLGIEYLHYQRIVHRDIKPANLLLGERGRVQVADLGVCDELSAGDDRCGVAGTPAFRAPEATHPTQHIDGKAADVWSLGVTLYCLVCGDVPFGGASVAELNARIRRAEPALPRRLSAPLRNLLQVMLHKDPEIRATLAQIKEHPWVTCNGTDLLPSEEENCRLVEITDEDVAQVVTSIPNLSTLILIKTMLKKHSFQNPFVRNRNSSGSNRASTEEGTASTGKRPVLSRSGRSVSAPGSYLTERQSSFDIPLPALNESTDQTPTESEQASHLGHEESKDSTGSVIQENVERSEQTAPVSRHTADNKTQECSDR